MMALHIHRWLSSDEGRAERFEHHNHALVCSDRQTPKRLTGRPPTGISADDHVESLVGTEINVKTGKINWTTGLTATTSLLESIQRVPYTGFQKGRRFLGDTFDGQVHDAYTDDWELEDSRLQVST